ncbi:MAG: hypothetical protein GF401_18370 [Chitinivibrionales bacterium]|nr:hypothetical protein [Chitinivibrionales bacterium]
MNYFRDEIDPPQLQSPNVRKGRFLWRKPDSQKEYLDALIQKIQSGYYSSNTVLENIVEEIAPVFSSTLKSDPSLY